MKILHRLTSIYMIVLALLVIVILGTLFTFKDMHSFIMKIAKLTEELALREAVLHPKSDNFPQLVLELESIRIRDYILFTTAMLTSAIGMLSIAYIYRKNIMEPLRKISSVVQKMAQGRFEKLPVMGGTEVGILAENFNSLGRTLEHKLREFGEVSRREQNAARTLNILSVLNTLVTRKHDIKEILETTISSSTTLIKSEIGVIVLIDRISRRVTHLISSLSQGTGDIKILARNTIYELTKPVRLSTFSKDERFDAMTEGINMQINSLLAVPIMIEGNILGGLILINKIGSEEFTPQDESQILKVSFCSSMAIENLLIHEEIVKLAKTDGLTGLNNHRTFYEELDVELKRAQRFRSHFSLLLIDIDYFKRFNDTYGHLGGDSALKGVADIIKGNLRGIDFAGRYGGEEFATLLPETDLDGALKTAERIRSEASKHTFLINNKEAHLTISIGVSVFPDDAEDKESLIKAADDALYMAKKLGRNQVVSFQQYIKTLN